MRLPKSAALVAAALGAGVALIGCSGGIERAVLSRYFNAARLRDNTALGAMATVDFNPAVDGIVTTFRVIDIAPDERQPINSVPPAVVSLSLEESIGQAVPDRTGDVVSRRVTISAPVKPPSGQTSTKTMVLTLSRAELRGGNTINGRWIVSARSAPR